jgi:DNA repair protein RadC
MFHLTIQTMKKTASLFQIAEVEIHYKRPKGKNSPIIKSSESAADIFREHFPKDRIDHKEFFYVMLLSQKNEVLGISQIGVGFTAGVLINIKEIFQLVLKTNATCFLISHNHPSNALKPSGADIKITEKIRKGAELFDCKLLDHIILSSESYYSFSDDGRL